MIRSLVPQGSILGPVLFIIFMNDISLCQVSDPLLSWYIYADDTTKISTAKTIDNLRQTMVKDSKPLERWVDSNGMVINMPKTKCVVVGTRARLQSQHSKCLDLSISNTPIEQVEEHKLLGLVIDQHLTWKSHLDYIGAKVAQRLALLRRIKSFLSTDDRHTFYRAMVTPLYEYGSIIWGDVSKHIANRITTLQKYAGRTILDIRNRREINSTELFKKLNWLPFSDLITFLRATLMFKCFNNAAPTYMSDKFHKLRDLHSIYTRQATADHLALPKFKLATAQNSFSFKGAKLWNSLPISIKSSTLLSSFKRNLSKHLRNLVK